MSECFLYLMQMMGAKKGVNDIVKVGISSDPIYRLASIQTANPLTVRLVTKWRLPSRQDAMSIEKQFHSDNKHVRISGEWVLGMFSLVWMEIDDAVFRYWNRRCPAGDMLAERLKWSGIDYETINALFSEHLWEMYGARP